jgi:hypothetical protein
MKGNSTRFYHISRLKKLSRVIYRMNYSWKASERQWCKSSWGIDATSLIFLFVRARRALHSATIQRGGGREGFFSPLHHMRRRSTRLHGQSPISVAPRASCQSLERMDRKSNKDAQDLRWLQGMIPKKRGGE